MTTRRNLLKSSLSLAAAPVGMSVAIEVAHAEDMPKWNNETDVLVLGYGNAGSNAAIAAADAGAKVLILEDACGRRKCLCFFRRLCRSDKQRRLLQLPKGVV